MWLSCVSSVTVITVFFCMVNEKSNGRIISVLHTPEDTLFYSPCFLSNLASVCLSTVALEPLEGNIWQKCLPYWDYVQCTDFGHLRTRSFFLAMYHVNEYMNVCQFVEF